MGLMLWSDVAKLPIILPGFSCKAYVVQGAEPASKLRFEWRHVHKSQLKIRSKIWEWLKTSDKGEALALLEIGPGDIVLGPRSSRGDRDGEIREHLVTTRALLGLVAHVAQARSSQHVSKKAAVALIVALAGFALSVVTRDQTCAYLSVLATNPRSGLAEALTIIVDPSGRVDLSDLLRVHPALEDFWVFYQVAGEAGMRSNFAQSDVIDFVLLCVAAKRSAHGAPMDRLLQQFLSGPMLALPFRFFASTLETFLIEEYRVPEGKSLDALRASKRRMRIDPDADVDLLERCDVTYGDGSALSAVLLHDRQRHRRLMHAHSVLHLARTKEVFGKCTHFHVSADPASYSGEHTQVAIGFSYQAGKAALLPIKVSRMA